MRMKKTMIYLVVCGFLLAPLFIIGANFLAYVLNTYPIASTIVAVCSLVAYCIIQLKHDQKVQENKSKNNKKNVA